MSLNQFDWSSEEYDGLFEKEVPSQLLQNPLLQKDIWQVKEDLKIEYHEHRKVLTLRFNKIKPNWLNLLAKIYILKRASLNLSARYLEDNLLHIKRFSIFLQQKYIESPKYINNRLFENFDIWLRSYDISERTISLYYTSLQVFFDTCNEEGWLTISAYWFKQRKVASKPSNKKKYIPEEVWNQLDEHLCHLPEPMQRQVLIIRTLGLRIGELLNLPLNCIRKRDDQWRIRLKETEKYKIEDEMPIPSDLVVVIKEQQNYIKDNLENNYKKLFCANKNGKNFDFTPVARVMRAEMFNTCLNKLADEHNICSKNGKIWHFTSHQFRRTVGTVMANAGIRDLIIQKYLRHRNPDMQNHYKHLFKEVVGNEYQELVKEKNFINIEGKLVATHKPQDVIEEYIRMRLHQITTQQGECHRSNLKKPCSTVNSCWRCRDWMTSEKDLPFLKKDIKRLKNELEKVTKLGMVRVAREINKEIDYLQVRVKALEDITKESD